MKKYNLHLKEEYRGKEAIKYPEITGHSELGRFKQYYILVGKFLKMDLSARLTNEAIVFTQKEIDNLPHGFVKLFDIIDVKEELYYIKLPYGSGYYLNEDMYDGDVAYANNINEEPYQKKFTLDYIKETFPLFAEFAVEVEEIDNE